MTWVAPFIATGMFAFGFLVAPVLVQEPAAVVLPSELRSFRGTIVSADQRGGFVFVSIPSSYASQEFITTRFAFDETTLWYRAISEEKNDALDSIQFIRVPQRQLVQGDSIVVYAYPAGPDAMFAQHIVLDLYL